MERMFDGRGNLNVLVGGVASSKHSIFHAVNICVPVPLIRRAFRFEIAKNMVLNYIWQQKLRGGSITENLLYASDVDNPAKCGDPFLRRWVFQYYRRDLKDLIEEAVHSTDANTMAESLINTIGHVGDLRHGCLVCRADARILRAKRERLPIMKIDRIF